MPSSKDSIGSTSLFTERRVYCAHLVLVVLLVVWRTLGSVPSLAPERGSEFFSAWPVEILAVVSILAAVAAAIVVVIGSIRAWRDWQIVLLLALFAASMWRRRGPLDALDIAYAVVTLLACARLFARARVRTS